MDNFWERSIPVYKPDVAEVSAFFQKFKSNFEVVAYNEVNAGCRNSNFIVVTTAGNYLLRITPPDDNGYINEIAACDVLAGKVCLPQLYFAAVVAKRAWLIFEYIEAVSLQSVFANRGRLDNEIIRQAAKAAAFIHNTSCEESGSFIENSFPPFTMWYEHFLSNEAAAQRLGNRLVERARNLISEKESMLYEIEKYQSLIHGDFRPANMLVDSENTVYFVDWEFTGIGHTLADIGQFFRYRRCFDDEHIDTFDEEYNKYAAVKLPSNWYGLCKLRDLVNPLQMLGVKGDAPVRNEDLRGVVLDTLEFFGY